jgi:uncharacterized protein DUF4136
MRVSKVMITLFGILFLAATVAKAQKVTTDYDPSAHFSSYKTFMWIEPPHIQADPLMEPRLVNAVNAALMSKGWQLVNSGADVGIVAHIATKERRTLQTFYDGFGGGWGWHRWGGGMGTAYTTVEPYEVGTLVLDLFDTHTKQLIWRGVGTDTLAEKPEKDTKKLEKAVDKMFKSFPPK